MASPYQEAVAAAQRFFHSRQDQQRFLRQMNQESHFTDAHSPAGAEGYAQLMPGTAAAWGVHNPHDPREAYTAAAQHMAAYLRQYGGSWRDALTAYNAGPGRVGGKLPAETVHYIDVVLNGSGDAHAAGGGSGHGSATIGGSPARLVPGTPPQVVPGQTTTDEEGALADTLLSQARHGLKIHAGGLLPALQARLASGAYTTTGAPQITDGTPAHVEGGTGSVTEHGSSGGDLAARATERANIIDAKHMPYLWGGGHQHLISDVHNATPLDCSGAVSAVLGINPRVASQFEGWGRPGDGGNHGVTIYAKGTHVLMKINGHFFGTSMSNPGGGAGWIPASAISPGYLAGFVARHGDA